MFEGSAVPEVAAPKAVAPIRTEAKQSNKLPEIKVRLTDHNNRGLQAALICADDNFDVAVVGKEGIRKKIAGDVREMFGWDNLGKVSANERLSAHNKQNLSEWKVSMISWLREYKVKMPAAYDLYKEMIGKMLNLPDGHILNTTNMEQLAGEIRNPSAGLAHFVEAALKVKNIDNPATLEEIGNLAAVFFGGETSREIILQAISLKLAAAKNRNNIGVLVEELHSEGLKAASILGGIANLDADHVLGEIDRLSKINSVPKIQEKANLPVGILSPEQVKYGQEMEGRINGAYRVKNQEGDPMDFEIYSQIVEGKKVPTLRAIKINSNVDMKIIWPNGGINTIQADSGFVIRSDDRFFYNNAFFKNNAGVFEKITDPQEIAKLQLDIERATKSKK